jgi:hypothetical protein
MILILYHKYLYIFIYLVKVVSRKAKQHLFWGWREQDLAADISNN